MNDMRRYMNLFEGVEAVPSVGKKEYKYKNVGCSQCGGQFGPGDHGFSHCVDHGGKSRADSEEDDDSTELTEKSTSEKQARFMAACAHGADYDSCPPDKVSKEFNKADKGTKQLSNAMKESMSGSSTDPVNTIRSVISYLHPGDTSPEAIAAEVPNLASSPEFASWCKQANDSYYGLDRTFDDDDYDYTDNTMHRGEMGDYSRDLVPEGEDDAFSSDPGQEFYTGDSEIPTEFDQGLVDEALAMFDNLVNNAFVDPEDALDKVMHHFSTAGAGQDELACIHDAISDHAGVDEAMDISLTDDLEPEPGIGLDEFDAIPGTEELGFEESYDFGNGYDELNDASGNDYFPNGASSPVVTSVGPSGAEQGDNPEQKKMQVSEVHRELVYGYRKFLKESGKR